MKFQSIKELQARENKIWQDLQITCEEDTQQKIGELIEINIELESRCNE